jgi:hypothetical protein
MKKIWETPQLIILARGTPEESVLIHCKRINALYANQAAAVGQVGCDYAEADGNCGACQARAHS